MMKFFSIAFLTVLLLATACKQGDQLPDGILSHDKMIDVTYDLMRAGEFLNSYVWSRNREVDRNADSRLWYDKVYALHKVTREQYEKSYAYYRERPEMMRSVMDSISRKSVMTETLPSPLGDTATVKKDSASGKKDTLKASPVALPIPRIDSLTKRGRMFRKAPR